MSLPVLFHSILLILTAIFPFFWTSNPDLSNYSLQLSALLLAVFLFHNLIAKRKPLTSLFIKYQYITNSIIITLLVLLLILDTGGLNSPLFFIANFLLFGLSLFFHPMQGFVLGLALSFLFLLNSNLTSINTLTNVISLLLMTPLARFFGTQYAKLLEAQDQIKILSYQSKHLRSTVSKEETTTLLWLSLEFRNKIYQALDLVSQLSSNLSFLPYHQKEQLIKLYQDLKALFQSGQELEKKIDRLTENEL